jgi:hypothetical protein
LRAGEANRFFSDFVRLAIFDVREHQNPDGLRVAALFHDRRYFWHAMPCEFRRGPHFATASPHSFSASRLRPPNKLLFDWYVDTRDEIS